MQRTKKLTGRWWGLIVFIIIIVLGVGSALLFRSQGLLSWTQTVGNPLILYPSDGEYTSVEVFEFGSALDAYSPPRHYFLDALRKKRYGEHFQSDFPIPEVHHFYKDTVLITYPTGGKIDTVEIYRLDFGVEKSKIEVKDFLSPFSRSYIKISWSGEPNDFIKKIRVYQTRDDLIYLPLDTDTALTGSEEPEKDPGSEQVYSVSDIYLACKKRSTNEVDIDDYLNGISEVRLPDEDLFPASPDSSKRGSFRKKYWGLTGGVIYNKTLGLLSAEKVWYIFFLAEGNPYIKIVKFVGHPSSKPSWEVSWFIKWDGKEPDGGGS